MLYRLIPDQLDFSAIPEVPLMADAPQTAADTFDPHSSSSSLHHPHPSFSTASSPYNPPHASYASSTSQSPQGAAHTSPFTYSSPFLPPQSAAPAPPPTYPSTSFHLQSRSDLPVQPPHTSVASGSVLELTTPFYLAEVGFVFPPLAGDPPHLMRRLQWQVVGLRGSKSQCGSCVCCPCAGSVRRRSPVVTAGKDNDVFMSGWSCGCWMACFTLCHHDASTSFRLSIDESSVVLVSVLLPVNKQFERTKLVGVCSGTPPKVQVHSDTLVDCSVGALVLLPTCVCGTVGAAPQPVIEFTAPLCPMDPAVQCILQALQNKKQEVEKANEALLSDIAFRVSRHLLAHPSVAPALTQPALQAAILAALLSHPIIFLLFPPFTPQFVSLSRSLSIVVTTSPSTRPRHSLLRKEVEADLKGKLRDLHGAALQQHAPLRDELCHLFDLFVAHQQQVALDDEAAASHVTEMNREIQRLTARQNTGALRESL